MAESKVEIEIKILNVDVKRVRSNLKKMGAKRTMPPTLFREIYWESPSKKRAYSSFRLRSEGKKSFLTVKFKKEDDHFEIRDECELEVADFDKAKKILGAIGFRIFRNREKIRERYTLNSVNIEVDQYPSLAPYIEVEGKTKKEVREFLKDLGFPFKYATNQTATEVIRSAGLNPDDLLFTTNKQKKIA